jgi:hypothetical protein
MFPGVPAGFIVFGLPLATAGFQQRLDGQHAGCCRWQSREWRYRVIHRRVSLRVISRLSWRYLSVSAAIAFVTCARSAMTSKSSSWLTLVSSFMALLLREWQYCR